MRVPVIVVYVVIPMVAYVNVCAVSVGRKENLVGHPEGCHTSSMACSIVIEGATGVMCAFCDTAACWVLEDHPPTNG